MACFAYVVIDNDFFLGKSILAWSKSPIVRVSVSIDGILLGDAMPSKSGPSETATGTHPLYVLPWNPKEWLDRKPLDGLSAHVIEVVCEVCFSCLLPLFMLLFSLLMIGNNLETAVQRSLFTCSNQCILFRGENNVLVVA